MKNIILIIATVLLISCEKIPPPHPILGDWRVQSCQVLEYVDNILVNDSLIKIFYSQHNETIRFIDSGMGMWIYDGIINKQFSWEVDASNQNLTIVEDVGESLNYKIHVGANTFLFTYNTNWTKDRTTFSYVAYRIN